MNLERLRKVITGLAMALSLTFVSGFLLPSTAEAQDRRWEWNNRRDDYRRDNYRDRDWYRRQQIERARAIQRAREIERARARDRYYGNSRNYPYYGNSGGYGRYGGYSSAEEERGYRNGLKEGRDDADDRDAFNPSRHSSFRDGNQAYRSGFYRGYQQGYREFSGRRW